jgi:hypothetical protein
MHDRYKFTAGGREPRHHWTPAFIGCGEEKLPTMPQKKLRSFLLPFRSRTSRACRPRSFADGDAQADLGFASDTPPRSCPSPFTGNTFLILF